MRQNRVMTIVAATGMLILILDSRTALTGAASGVELCIKTLIPSLFPFFVMSILLTDGLAGQNIPILKPLAAACKIPEGTESALAIGFLGGYPVGAQNVSVLYQKGYLSRLEAMRMLVFCNNAGPAFIFGVLSSLFTQAICCWYLWIIQMISALAVGCFIPGCSDVKGRPFQMQKISMTDTIAKSVKVMSLVCGWVVFMRLLLEYASKWILCYFPPVVQTVLCGILELSNGCIRLSEIQNEGLRFITASALLSLGGVCVTLQTSAVSAGIPMGLYFPGKLLQCCISLIFSYVLQAVLPFSATVCSFLPVTVCGIMATIIVLYLRYPKIMVAFRNLLVYNRRSYTKEVSSCCFTKK